MRLRLHRLFTAPAARVESVDGDRTRLRIDGLVCDSLCAARTERALSAIDGVRSVAVDFERGMATIVGAAAGPAAYERALQGVVVGRALRRALDSLRRAVRRRARGKAMAA